MLRVVLQAASDGIAEVIAQLPEISSVPAGTKVVIVGRVAAPAGLLARIFSGKKSIPRAVRSSALLARGFVDIAAAREGSDDLVWGYSPS